MRARFKIWEELLFFESSHYTAARYSLFHGGKANAAKLAEIGSAFRQARLFHESFEKADFAVRPLILYYSALALARGIILFLEPMKRESHLAQRHGLGSTGWGEFLNQEVSKFTELKVKIESGTFLELLGATKNINLIRANSSAINYHLSTSLPPQGLEVSLGTLCQHIPDLADEYEKWTGEKIVVAKVETIKAEGEKIEFKIANLKGISGLDQLTEAYVKQLFPQAEAIDMSVLTVAVNTSGIPIVSGIIELAPFQIGDAVVLPRIGGEFFSDLGILFMISYALGMLARYHPSHWIALQSIGPRGQFFPYCSRLIEYIGYSYPRAVVDVLANLDRLK
jgi:hypothetical protein